MSSWCDSHHRINNDDSMPDGQIVRRGRLRPDHSPQGSKTSKSVGRIVDRKVVNNYILIAIIFIDSTSYALVLPLLPALLHQYEASGLIGGILIASYACAAAISSPILGYLSDRYGRRPVLIVSLIGSVIAHLVFAFSASVTWFLCSRIMAGAMAGNIGVVEAAIADQTAQTSRAIAMGRVMAAWALGFVVGPALNLVVPLDGARIAFWPGMVAAGLATLAVVACSVGLFDDHRASPDRMDFRAGRKAATRNLSSIVVFGVLALVQSGVVAMTGFWSERTFGWGPREVSLLFLWTAVCIIVFQTVFLPATTKRFGELKTLYVGLSISIFCLAGLLAGHSSAIIFIAFGPLLICGITLAQAIFMSMISASVDISLRGALIGVANLSKNIGRIVGPIVLGFVFSGIGPIYIYVFSISVLSLSVLFFISSGARARST